MRRGGPPRHDIGVFRPVRLARQLKHAAAEARQPIELDRFGGNPALAAAAYNAGPGRPRNWRAQLPQTVEGAVFAELVPFDETRDYVKKVLSNATVYGALISGKPPALKPRLGGPIGPRSGGPGDRDLP